MWSRVCVNDSCVSLECVNERGGLCTLGLSVCRCWEALSGICVCVCATARPTYSIIRGEQLDEAKQVVLDTVVKIWVKTGSFTAPCFTLTLLAIVLWIRCLCVCLRAGVHVEAYIFHVFYLCIHLIVSLYSPLFLVTFCFVMVTASLLTYCQFSSSHSFHLFHSCIIEVTALFVPPFSFHPPSPAVVSSECPMGVTA